jgi:SAM-dependent methyltransferase
MNIFEIMTKKWNEKATDQFRHVEINQTILDNYEKYLNGIDLKNKVVIDYGCGGGYLGKYLFEEKDIKKYIGFDICDISINAAKKLLKEYDAKIVKVKSHIDFSQYKADVFVSLECIQHFPTKRYLDNFLKGVNNSKIKELLIQYRFGNLIFTPANVMTWMCKLPLGYLTKHLTNYIPIARNKHIADRIKKEWIYFKDSLDENQDHLKTKVIVKKDEIIEEEIKNEPEEILTKEDIEVIENTEEI